MVTPGLACQYKHLANSNNLPETATSKQSVVYLGNMSEKIEEIELPKGRLKNKNKNKIHWR